MDKNIDLRVTEAAARRWQERKDIRDGKLASLRAGRVTEVESPERIQMRVQRLEAAAVRERTARAVIAPPPSLVERIGVERVLGQPDFLNINFIELALAVSRFVGRIHIRAGVGRTTGFGTGFMVSPRLLLTNNHVLGSAQEAQFSEVEFDYQNDRYGRLLPVAAFGLEPRTFFLTSEELDFTLVAVQERSPGGVELKNYGWSRLIGEQGKALHGDSLNIIQHPKGEVKQVVLRSNHLVDLFDNFAHYLTDTEPGSSGSPVYNDLWEVVALHHSGVPKMENGNYIAKDGSIWRPGMDPANLAWVANEGIRVSSLVEYIRKAQLTPAQSALREELLNLEPPHPMEVAAVAAKETPGAVSGLPATNGNGSYTWTIPLQISVSIGTPAAVSAYTAAIRQPAEAAPDRAYPGMVVKPSAPVDMLRDQEAISIDPDYSNRKGYDPAFLGTGSRRVPLPKLTPAMRALAAINTEANGGDRHVLPYHHFSVVMHRERKLAFFTAVNIDGNITHNIKREKDKWFIDPRIEREEQTDNSVYASNPLDRGHLVRRLDPAWGDSRAVAKVANDDTFHFTNCSPQHQDFNQNRATWAGLEDYILKNADVEDLKISVFTGPVFSDDDPPYRGVNLPRQFWKVVAMVKENGKLSATAYLLSQESLLDGLEEEFTFGAYKTFQVPVRTVEELTGLKFGNLTNFDPLESLESFRTERSARREIRFFEDVRL